MRLTLLAALLLAACGASQDPATPAATTPATAAATPPAAAERIASLLAAGQRPDAAAAAQLAGSGALLLDVRSEQEWKDGHVRGARFIPWDSITAASTGLPADRQAPIVTYCVAGVRAQRAALALQKLGYTRVVAVDQGGFQELAAAGLPVER